MNIYEIDSQILSCIDEETGEILDTERLEKLIQDRQNKIESVACWYKNVVAEAEAIKAEIAVLKARKEHDEKLAENLKRDIFQMSLTAKISRHQRFQSAIVNLHLLKSMTFTSFPMNFLHTKLLSLKNHSSGQLSGQVRSLKV